MPEEICCEIQKIDNLQFGRVEKMVCVVLALKIGFGGLFRNWKGARI